MTIDVAAFTGWLSMTNSLRTQVPVAFIIRPFRADERSIRNQNALTSIPVSVEKRSACKRYVTVRLRSSVRATP